MGRNTRSSKGETQHKVATPKKKSSVKSMVKRVLDKGPGGSSNEDDSAYSRILKKVQANRIKRGVNISVCL